MVYNSIEVKKRHKEVHMSKKEGVKRSKNLELLYFAEQEVTVKDLERSLINKLEEIHVWPELGIMELNFPNGIVADVETMTEYMEDEEDLRFMTDRKLKSVYAITIEENGLKELIEYVRCWIQEYGGLLCSDSDDFAPFYIQ